MLSVILYGIGVLWPAASCASKPHCRLERLDLSTLDKDGQLHAIAGVVELEGQVNVDRNPGSFRLQIDGKTAARAEKAMSFEKSGVALYLVLAVETSALFAPKFEKIKAALHDFLERLPPHTCVKLMPFGNSVDAQKRFKPPRAVGNGLDDMTPDDEGDVQLVNALQGALKSFSKLLPCEAPGPGKTKGGEPPPPRKLIVVLSDGLNQIMDRQYFRRIGDQLRNNGVPLFPIAFSANDDRGPLLNLGEMAKRSAGTFRWARNDDDLREQFLSLADEIRRAHVLTFTGKKLNADKLRTATLALQCGELKSNPYLVTGAPPPAPKSVWWHWVLGIVLGLFGLWGVAQGGLWLLKRRLAAAAAPGQAAGAAPRPPAAPGPYAAPRAAASPGYAPPAYPAGQAAGGYQAAPGYAPGGRPLTATLIAIGSGQLGGKRFKIEAGVVIGRAVSGPATIPVPDDASVAPSHCELRRDAAGFVLIDLKSPGGSFVNDRRVAGSARLNDGDLVRLGESTQFKFRIDD